jgi:hypothetical protein
MISLIEHFTAGDSDYTFEVTWRYSSGTNIARCNGKTASCTGSSAEAIRSAARKHFAAMCASTGLNFESYRISKVEEILSDSVKGASNVTFSLKPEES